MYNLLACGGDIGCGLCSCLRHSHHFGNIAFFQGSSFGPRAFLLYFPGIGRCLGVSTAFPHCFYETGEPLPNAISAVYPALCGAHVLSLCLRSPHACAPKQHFLYNLTCPASKIIIPFHRYYKYDRTSLPFQFLHHTFSLLSKSPFSYQKFVYNSTNSLTFSKLSQFKSLFKDGLT